MPNHLDLAQWKRIFLDQILSDIYWAIDSKRNLAAAQLILSAIDVIAGLDRPSSQVETSGDIFIQWCDAHMALTGTNCTLTGLDLWGARCGFLHGYTPIAKVVRQGRARMLGYVDEAQSPVMGSEEVPDLLIISLRSLAAALAQGMAASMKRANNDELIGPIVNQRMETMFHSIDLPGHFWTV